MGFPRLFWNISRIDLVRYLESSYKPIHFCTAFGGGLNWMRMEPGILGVSSPAVESHLWGLLKTQSHSSAQTAVCDPVEVLSSLNLVILFFVFDLKVLFSFPTRF